MTVVVAERFFLARRVHAFKNEDHIAEFDIDDFETEEWNIYP